MIFQCSDLERALQSPELMPDAVAHAENCERCRNALFLWSEISRVAPQLHEEWESPGLWRKIEVDLAAAAPRRKVASFRRFSMAVGFAATLVLAVVLMQPWNNRGSERAFLTDQALDEVQRAESAYARSIEKLSALADESLRQSPAPLAAAYREKLLLLDSAIAELKTNVEQNRYNPYLRTQLAMLYREKQETLQEWINHAKVS